MNPNLFTNTALLTRREAAAYLGISTSTLANWACTKKYSIPYFRVGRSVRYRKNILDEFIQNNAVDIAQEK